MGGPNGRALGRGMITRERKQQLITDFRRRDDDTGSPEVQIAILTSRINQLTEHMQSHKKDYASRRGLLGMVSRRRRLLDYLKRVSPDRYLDMLRRLDLRK
jgi:small subunit ribosomal protein S15